ncbi:MAG: polynucleotide kinase-phosphatase [Zoogloeaceae bacterium]|nr:polynucleotide kinase-phosphatase [Zoogloeaceae bacterium]
MPTPFTIEIPEFAVVMLMGASGSGKSTFAKKHFRPTEILSSDYFRGLVSDDENNQLISSAAFEALYYVANKRLDIGRLTVIDATNVQQEARADVLRLARAQDCHAIAIVLDMPAARCVERNASRPDRDFGEHVVRRQADQLRRSLRHLEKEGFRYVFVLKDEAQIDAVEIVRKPLWNNKREEHGPFDIIGDVHGCFAELCALIEKLGYRIDPENLLATHPEGRKLVFLGDLCDRGPENVQVLRLVMRTVKAGGAYCVIGNHDFKLLKFLKGRQVTRTHGLDGTIAELEAASPEFRAEVRAFLESLISHYVFDDGKLVAAHAGIKEKFQGRGSGRVKEFCMYGETTGETDEYGLPVRLDWANDYRGAATVVFGHTPNPEAQQVNRTVCIDTGCVFGGKLTALRYPEQDIVDVPAAREYYRPQKPLSPIKAAEDDLLNIEDVLRQNHLTTRLKANIKVREENAMAALEVMSRFALDPHWLIYLPPTMSPSETSALEDYLEHPREAFDHYRTRGVGKVVCEQKHMGSRAVILLCRDVPAAQKRFKTQEAKRGVIHTRTGRAFFAEDAIEAALLDRLDAQLTATGFWDDFQTDWVCLDAEIMPWSAKAQQLLEAQYAPVGRAGGVALARAAQAIAAAQAALAQHPPAAAREARPGQSAQDTDLAALLTRAEARQETLARYTGAYRRYCWEVRALDDYRIAPFHVLASEGKVWSRENHVTHMETIARYIAGSDPLFMATPYRVVDTLDETSMDAGIAWWEELTASGGEGMVVKPHDFIATKGNELLQPAIKCRGREYLRIIYGPEYTLHLERLKKRGLAQKRRLAINEFALGMEAIERFVRKEPLYRVHECVFAVLAMESEPVDPRL